MVQTTGLSSFLQLSRIQLHIQSELEKSSFEATKGHVKNYGNHLSGATLSASLLVRKIEIVNAQEDANKMAAQFADSTEVALSGIHTIGASVANDLVLIDQASSQRQVDLSVSRAEGAFRDVVSKLNESIGGKFLFSGSSYDKSPLLPADDILANLELALGGATTVTDVETAIDDWFDSPTGGFSTVVYNGSETGYLAAETSGNVAVQFSTRADNQNIKLQLKALAKVSFANTSSIGLTLEDQQQIIIEARADLMQAQDGILGLRSANGLTQQRLTEVGSELERANSDLELELNRTVGVDQFEAAARFEIMQHQLSLLYEMSARRGSVSLLNFLR